ncbi:MAG: GNAT family N-acetyltransferase, partial [Methylovulum sp.]
MNIPDYRIEPADYRADFNDLRAVRESVFVIEQNIPLEIEFDDIDPQCHHVIARDAQHQPLGTARLTPEHKIGRMAVISERRNQGIGKALLLALIDKAGKLGWTEVAVNAQLPVLGFYEKLGFTGYGEVFDEAGISHQAMRLTFQPVAVVSRPAPKPRSASVKPLEFNTLETATAATLQLITQARRQLCIISHGLDYDLYAQKEIMDAFKQFAIHSRDGCEQIIIQDATLARSRPHHPLL